MFDEQLREIAVALVAHCRAGTESEGLDTLYAPDAVSVEAAPTPGTDRAETHGVEAIKGKHAWWKSAMEVHSSAADGPYLHGADRFAVIFQADVTNRETGERLKMMEIGLYTVAGGKIVREEFFYSL